MKTVFNHAVSAIVACLRNEPKLSEEIYHQRGREVDGDVQTAIDVALISADPIPGTISGRVYWKSIITVSLYAKQEGENPGGEAVDALLSAVYNRLSGVRSELISGVDIGEPALTMDTSDKADSIGWTQLQYTIDLPANGRTLECYE